MKVERIHFNTISSTNTWAKEHASEFDPSKLICITADEQTAGRGRFPGRKWISKKGNLHMTLFLSAPPDPNFAQILIFSAAHILAKEGIALQIKWPNDLLFNGKKFAGCLVETTPYGVVLGIGMNVNENVHTDQPTTSLKEISGKTWDVENLATQITEEFLRNWTRGFSDFWQEFQGFLAYKGQWVKCEIGKEIVEGTLLGITNKGFLQIEKENGEVVELSSGEIQQS